jgi:PAS domain S-box-containing protein
VLRDAPPVHAIDPTLVAAIVSCAEDAIIGKNLDGIIMFWNPAATRLFGYAAAEMLGTPILRLIPPELQHEEQTILAHIRAGMRVEPFDTVRIASDGRRLPVSIAVSPILDAAGQVIGASKSARDITARRAAELAARVSEERFRLVSKATSDVIFDCDLQSQDAWWNEGLRVVFGYETPPAEPGLRAWLDRVAPQDRDRVADSTHAFLASRDERASDVYRFLKSDGSAARVIDRKFLIRAPDGEPLRLLISLADDTERHDLDERLRQAQKLEAVGQLTGGVAHDFNNLLTVILGNAELLADSLPPDGQLRMLAEMTATAAERGAQLTSRLLAFARRQALAPRTIDIGALLSSLEGLMRRTLSESIDIAIVRGGGLWPATIDPSQLEVAILNLVINARDAMPSGGSLTLETANASLDADYAASHAEVAPGPYVMISVTDTGTGMSQETLRRAFEPFFTTKDIGKGSGLGLSMVYGFIKQSNGHVSIYSEIGQGTTIKLYLPRAASDGLDVLDRTVASATLPTGSETVLVVEDDHLVREHVTLQLRGLGYRVLVAREAGEALAAVEQNAGIDLLFTDVVMPGGMNGPVLAVRVRALQPRIKVLYTSGYTENAIIHNGQLDPGIQLLSKPYRKEDLARKVRAVLDA